MILTGAWKELPTIKCKRKRSGVQGDDRRRRLKESRQRAKGGQSLTRSEDSSLPICGAGVEQEDRNGKLKDSALDTWGKHRTH